MGSQPLQHPGVGTRVLESDDQNGLGSLLAYPPSEQTAALEFTEEEEQGSVRVEDILACASGVVGSIEFGEFVPVRDSAVFCFAPFGAPTTVGQFEIHGCIEGSAIDAGLPA